jgi:arsenate reductase (thioredoxin)
LAGVLFVCGENSARSQMAEAYFNHFSAAWVAESAGTLPGSKVNPLAVLAMAEDGIDISLASPRRSTFPASANSLA